MATALAGDDLARSSSRRSFGSLSGRRGGSWASSSFREALQGPPNASLGETGTSHVEDEEQLIWAAIERLPTYDRLRKGVLKQVLEDGTVSTDEIDLVKLGTHQKNLLLKSILKVVEEDYEKFLLRLRARIDRLVK